MGKIKIIHIIGKLQMGGAERLLYDLCRKIDKEKFSVQVVTVHGGGAAQKMFETAGIKVVNFNKAEKWDFAVIKRLADYLRGERPDVAHTHLFAGDFWGGIAARRAGVPQLISTRHDVLKEGWPRDFLGKWARKKCDKVVAISQFIFEHLVKKEGIDFQKITIIYNGIDMTKFYNPGKNILKTDLVTIGAVGRMSKEKGHKHLLRAGRLLLHRNWQMLFAGAGPCRALLEKLVHSLGIENKVKFLGELEDVMPVLRNIDIFVLPSASEGLSLALLEAAAAGCFVIATRVGGVPEVVSNGVTGKLFKAKRIEQLVAHLNWVIANPEQARRMAQKLQAEVVAKFDLNVMAQQYMKMYEGLAGK
ncbi:MAG: glycosyltransferase [Candidatus Falkowbacteria bacterium]